MIEITHNPLIDGIIDGITILPRFLFDLATGVRAYDLGFVIGVVIAGLIIIGVFIWILAFDCKDVE